jgi:outer membrane protein assembly factor BamB
MLTKSLLACSCVALAVSSSRADNWPRFRGPNGVGVAKDTGVPVQFDDKSIAWKVALPGRGNASPVIWDDRVFIQSATNTERMLLCLDAASGKTLWKRSVPGGKGPVNEYNTLASATPATDGKVVVNTFWDGKGLILAAYDMDGAPLWQKKLGQWISQHGPGASPILYRDMVIYIKDMDYKDKNENDVSDPSVVWVFNKMTGAQVWTAPREAYRACYSAPFILEKPDAPPQLIITSTTSIRSYDPANGQVKWDWRWSFKSKMPLRTTASSLEHNGMLFACSGDGGGDRHMVALRLIGNGMPTKAEFAWENRKDFPYVPTLLARGDHLYFVNDKGFAGCFQAATGKQVWLERLPDTKFTSSPVLIDGKMYAPSEQGDVYVIAAEPAYRLLAKNPLGERFRSSPAVANGRLYLRGESHLFCIGKR